MYLDGFYVGVGIQGRQQKDFGECYKLTFVASKVLPDPERPPNKKEATGLDGSVNPLITHRMAAETASMACG